MKRVSDWTRQCDKKVFYWRYLVSRPILGLNNFVSSWLQCLFVDLDNFEYNEENWKILENQLKPFLICGVLIQTSDKKPFRRGRKIMWKDCKKYHIVGFSIVPVEYCNKIMHKLVYIGIADMFHFSISKTDSRNKAVLRLSNKRLYDGGLKLIRIFDYGDEMTEVHEKMIDLYCKWLHTDKPQQLKYYKGKKRKLCKQGVTHTLYETKIIKNPFAPRKERPYDLSLGHRKTIQCSYDLSLGFSRNIYKL